MEYLRLFIFLLPISLLAQDYDDVAVLMNIDDPESVLIGEYFQAKNDVPDRNMLYISMPTSEFIDSMQYATIAEEVRMQFDSNSLSSEINYIVTTKGCPQALDLNLGAQFFSPKRPFEILMSNLSTSAPFPLLQEYNEPFSFDETGYRIVSRLEAGSLEGTFRLIDRGGAQTININLGFIIDLYAPFTVSSTEIENSPINEILVSLQNDLDDMGIDSVLDTAVTYYNKDTDVSIYSQVGWGNSGVPISPFVNRTKDLSILMMGESGLKSNYGKGLSVYDFLEGQCHAAIGCVDYFYSSRIRFQSKFFQYYLDIENMYTLGESAFASINSASPFVLFGDPKSKVELITSSYNLETPIIKDIYPIPVNEFLNLDFEDQKERIIVIYDTNGKLLFSQKIISQENQIDVSTLPNGFLIVAIQENEKVDVRKIIKM